MHFQFSRLALAAIVSSFPAYSQFFSVGVKGGIPMTDSYSAGSNDLSSATPYDRRYIIGPTAEVHLPFHLSFEADALFRRNGFDFHYGSLIGQHGTLRTKVNDWQFPLLGKYELRFGPLRPFVDAGVVYRHVSTSGSAGRITPDNTNGAGFTVGGGVTLKLLLVRLSPEIRYSHWPTPPFHTGNQVLSSTTNQADFLLGLTF
jgi:opacity protein-like surface antigen